MTFILIIKFFPLDAQLQGTFSCSQFFRKVCSSNCAADGLSTGSICKQHCKKSLTLDDNVSGMGGVFPCNSFHRTVCCIKYDKKKCLSNYHTSVSPTSRHQTTTLQFHQIQHTNAIHASPSIMKRTLERWEIKL